MDRSGKNSITIKSSKNHYKTKGPTRLGDKISKFVILMNLHKLSWIPAINPEKKKNLYDIIWLVFYAILSY